MYLHHVITFISILFQYVMQVDALDNDTPEKVKLQLQAGEMFGVMQGIYPNCGHIYTYRANRYTIVLTLKRSNWINLLDFFPASKNIIYDKKKEKMFMTT